MARAREAKDGGAEGPISGTNADVKTSASSSQPGLGGEPNSIEISSSRYLKPRPKDEPPTTENLEEYRRKLSFLANLLNSPRWTLPDGEAVLTKMVRNERVPIVEQQAELGMLSTVQRHVQNALRTQLQLPTDEGRVRRQNMVASINSPDTNDEALSEASRDDLMDQETPTSPTKRLLSVRATASSPRASSSIGSPGRHTRDALDDIFISPEGEEDEYYDNDDSNSESRRRHGSSDSDIDAREYEEELERGKRANESNERPVARQLWRNEAGSGSNGAYSTEFGRKLAKGDEDNDESDLSRLLSADIQMQDQLTDDLVKYASAMKESALHAGKKIRDDTKKLDKMADRMYANTDAAKSATSTVDKLLNAPSMSIWGTLSTLSTVIIVFVCIYVFMKIVPKP